MLLREKRVMPAFLTPPLAKKTNLRHAPEREDGGAYPLHSAIGEKSSSHNGYM